MDPGTSAYDLAQTHWGRRFVQPEIELQYGRWHIAQATPLTRIGMLGSLFAWSVVIGTYAILRPPETSTALALILGVTLPVIIAALVVTYRPARAAWVLPLTAVANALAGLTTIAIGLLAGGRMSADFRTAGLIIVAYFGLSVFRMRPALAITAVASYVVTWQMMLAGLLVRGAIPASMFVWNTTAMLVAFGTGAMVCIGLDRVSRESFKQERVIERQKLEIENERGRADRLLASILPDAIATRLKDHQGVIADRFDGVTVIFADVVGFTPLAARVTPERLVAILDEVFSRFDSLADRHGVEKIKTIGDAYMAVAGVPRARADHADAAARMAVAMRDSIEAYADENEYGIRLRIGLASGPAVAGVIGTRKFAYDLWGDTVNTAARMESHGIAGAIHVAESTRNELKDAWTFEDRGEIEVKGKGLMRTFVLIGTAANAMRA